jgi:hypothetical protein
MLTMMNVRVCVSWTKRHTVAPVTTHSLCYHAIRSTRRVKARVVKSQEPQRMDGGAGSELKEGYSSFHAF